MAPAQPLGRIATAVAVAAIAVLISTAAAATHPDPAAAKDRGGARQGDAGFRIGLRDNFRIEPRCRSHRALLRLRRRHPDARRCPRRVRPATAGPASSIYWGAWIGDQLTGDEAPWDMSAVARFEQLAGKQLSIVHFSSPFANCASSCYHYDFPSGPMDGIREHGAIPFFSWASQSIPSTTSEPDFQLSDVLAGDYDSYIRSFATDAARWGHPFFLRFNWEMNGNWFPWSESVNGNGPGQSVAVWRHVHDIFRSVGATNATWVWCPNVDPEGRFQDLGSLYPGDGYVDWTCLDGYNWGAGHDKQTAWMSFDRIYDSSYHRIVDTIAPSKPMIIGEVGSSENGGSKAAWIADTLDRVPTAYPRIRGLLWFEKFDDGMDWPIETSPGATSAFAEGIQNPAYAANGHAGLGASPIPPPP